MSKFLNATPGSLSRHLVVLPLVLFASDIPSLPDIEHTGLSLLRYGVGNRFRVPVVPLLE